MARVIWKGAISFGLVHIPVALQSATSSQTIDFDWLDKRTIEPVGYKRINKVSGKDISQENIVKGIQYQKGQYVILSEEEIKTAHPASTQTIDIFSFVESTEIPLANIDTPYYLAPDKRGEKVYALLRETLTETNKVALAYVILHTRQHLAALMPIDNALVLVLLRWPSEVRSLEELALTKATTHAELTKSEKEMAKRLVSDMEGKWQPDEYRDSFQEKIMELVERKAQDGEIENLEGDVIDVERKSADIIDLTELLKRSLGGVSRGTGKSPSVNQSSNSKSKTKSTETKSTAAPKKTVKAESSKTSSKSSKTTPSKAAPSKVTPSKAAPSKAHRTRSGKAS